MPLRDHFRSPVRDRITWGEFHGMWPAGIVRELHGILPDGYSASPTLHLGSQFEIDVSTFKDRIGGIDTAPTSGEGGSATLTALAPTFTAEADLIRPDEVEVRIFDDFRQLVAAIEIVSPANKDRPDTRKAFVGKVAALLAKDVCVSIVDLVTIRQFNLYAELLASVGRTDPALEPSSPHLYAVTLHTRKLAKGKPKLDVWFYPMGIGEPLPTLPIWLTPDLRVMLPLETSYEETCEVLGIG